VYSSDFETPWWMLSQKRVVRTTLHFYYYHRVDVSAGGLLVYAHEGIIHLVVVFSTDMVY
jgi:hypothetical protein